MATYLSAAELTRLEKMAGEAHKPTSARMLDEDDFDAHALQALLKDSAGLTPIDPDTGITTVDYVNTVDLYRAASYAWHQKAGVYAEQFEFKADGGLFKRNQAYDMCVKQAARYADMAQSNTTTIAPVARDNDSIDAFQAYLDE